MSTPLPDVAAVRRALARRDLVYGLSVDQVMSVVGPVLEDRDREIESLHEQLTDVAVRLHGMLNMPAEGSGEGQ